MQFLQSIVTHHSFLPNTRNERRQTQTLKNTNLRKNQRRERENTDLYVTSYCQENTISLSLLSNQLTRFTTLQRQTLLLFHGNNFVGMEAENEDFKKKERVAMVTILVFASVAIASLIVAFSYYCYLRYKVSKRFKTQKKSQYISISIFLIEYLIL